MRGSHAFSYDDIIRPLVQPLMILHESQGHVFVLFGVDQMVISFFVPGDWLHIIDIKDNWLPIGTPFSRKLKDG
jgi:hypothetical protein